MAVPAGAIVAFGAFLWLLDTRDGPRGCGQEWDLTMLQFLLQHDTGRDFKCRSVEVLLEAATSFETRRRCRKTGKVPVMWSTGRSMHRFCHERQQFCGCQVDLRAFSSYVQ
ncbi:hypothetical protein GQ600_5466 [Phytophthora cactorum]|nr:hypothetical protein GQ600_5466 [Phytophthora cactorum]